MRHLRVHLAFGVLLVLLVSACSGPRERTPGGEPRDDAPAETEREPEREPDAPVTRTVQGYRIQVYTSSEKAEADAEAARASSWWESLSAGERPLGLQQDEAPVAVVWRQPYYRVRVGAFASRSEAERALSLIKQRFGKAFIVPDRVTVTR